MPDAFGLPTGSPNSLVGLPPDVLGAIASPRLLLGLLPVAPDAAPTAEVARPKAVSVPLDAGGAEGTTVGSTEDGAKR